MARVTVLMPVYNAKSYLREAIDSILAQTFTDFEFLIIDDGSEDDSKDILDEYARLDKRIRLEPNKKNIGLTATLNRGIQLATGDYIARMDDNDICHPDRLIRQIEFLDKHRNIGLLGSNYSWIEVNGTPRYLGKSAFHIGASPPFFRWSLLWGCPMAHPTIMVRRSLILNEPYDTVFIASEDYELWARLDKLTDCVRLSEVLLQARYVPGGVSERNRLTQRHFIGAIVLRELDYHFGTTLSQNAKNLFAEVARYRRTYDKWDIPTDKSTVKETLRALAILAKRFAKSKITDKERTAIFDDALRYGLLISGLSQQSSQRWCFLWHLKSPQLLWVFYEILKEKFFSKR